MPVLLCCCSITLILDAAAVREVTLPTDMADDDPAIERAVAIAAAAAKRYGSALRELAE
jgi:hypothetical protein